jgi:hypothetical protein
MIMRQLTAPRRVLAAAAAAACLVPVGLQAATAARQAPFQINVQKEPNWSGGEPEIAVNPRNPNNLVMVWAAMKVYKTSTGPAEIPLPRA